MNDFIKNLSREELERRYEQMLALQQYYDDQRVMQSKECSQEFLDESDKKACKLKIAFLQHDYYYNATIHKIRGCTIGIGNPYAFYAPDENDTTISEGFVVCSRVYPKYAGRNLYTIEGRNVISTLPSEDQVLAWLEDIMDEYGLPEKWQSSYAMHFEAVSSEYGEFYIIENYATILAVLDGEFVTITNLTEIGYFRRTTIYSINDRDLILRKRLGITVSEFNKLYGDTDPGHCDRYLKIEHSPVTFSRSMTLRKMVYLGAVRIYKSDPYNHMSYGKFIMGGIMKNLDNITIDDIVESHRILKMMYNRFVKKADAIRSLPKSDRKKSKPQPRVTKKAMVDARRVFDEVHIGEGVDEGISDKDFLKVFKRRVSSKMWKTISCDSTLSEDFVRAFRDKIDWSCISRHYPMTMSFVKKYYSKLDFKILSENKTLSEDIIDRYSAEVDWIKISMYQNLSEDFIRKFRDSVHWDSVSRYQKFSIDFIREFKNRLNLDIVTPRLYSSEDLIREFSDIVNWNTVSALGHLSEDFIREFQDKIVWSTLVKYQSLSKDLLLEYSHKLIWDGLDKRQNLPENFVEEARKRANERRNKRMANFSERFRD